MLPNGEYILYSFVSPNSGKVGLMYPEDEVDALNKIKQASPRIVDKFLPLLGKLSILTAAASDIWFDRNRGNSKALVELLKIPGDIKRYSIARESNGHPLNGLTDERHIPERFGIVELEGYDAFIRTLALGGYRFPTFFRSHELGMYFSSQSPWDNESIAAGIREVLGYNGVVDMERGLIIPATWPDGYKDSWNQRLEYIRHQMLLQAYEDIPQSERRELLRQCSEIVERSVDLRNQTYLPTEIPQHDPSSPYAFRNYSRPQQEKILAGFIAGTLALNKDLYTYWAGPHLHGDGTSRLDWAPQGVLDLLEDHGFLVSEAPASKIHPHYIRHVRGDGEVEKSDRPFANPDLVIADDGTVHTIKPKDLSEVILLPGFSFLPPLERLHRDLEEVYGLKLDFPTSLLENDKDLTDLIPLDKQFHASALKIIASELEKYPPEYIQGLGLVEVRVVEGISLVDPRTPDKKAPLGGLCIPEERTIYLKFGYFTPEAINHELRHRADVAFRIADDDKWALLNPNGLQAYSRLKLVDYLEGMQEDTTVKSGFATAYAGSNEREDRASIAELLFTKPGKLMREAGGDPVLRAKIEALLQILEAESQGVMDEGWRKRFLDNLDPFTDPVIFAQTISYGYLTHPSAYFAAKEKLARAQGMQIN